MATGEDVLRDLSSLSQTWRERMGDRPPIAHEFPTEHRDRWVRFHSLPESKRYASDAAERRTILERHYAVLGELFGGEDVFIMTSTWSTTPEPEPRDRLDLRINPGSVLWWSFLSEDDSNPDLVVHTHVYVAWTGWSAGSLNRLLSAVAEYRAGNVVIGDRRLRRLYLPYDGGADVLAVDSAERDVLRDRHSAWLSGHPSGR
ncbi:hypothetical protein KGQ19_06720 [Catenulispora sp. NL8]|uniref:DUF3885 domain-containing protein n=1 Tax=Catenulispora pinistramenti TaxID=2705254 RepID=A0ABS5KK37_9ACTN|nr:hypothetical protein [Catenulispora pinistramenti]MBS2546555.1 hypothetical protein [Catenulispora pinistramenti]